MTKILVTAILLLLTLPARAQEKVIHVQKKDGTSTRTRMAELKELSFLTTAEGGQGLVVKTSGGQTAAVRFDANPVVTIAKGKLIVRSSAADAVEFEIADVAEILFGDATQTSIGELRGFDYVLQEGGALLRGIPAGTKARVYTLSGRSLPTPNVEDGQLRLNRSTFGTGIFIVKIGKFSTKIRL